MVLIFKDKKEVTLRIKLYFFIYTSINKILINVHAKVHLNSFIRLKIIYLKLQENMIIVLHKSNYLLFLRLISGRIHNQNFLVDIDFLASTFS